ncbi:MAG TPA: leucyl aminopeptidase family protein [Phycisphaerales bacterium]|nr:leucyl aminopeptidase family protein [Phycisphaerales bacterium]
MFQSVRVVSSRQNAKPDAIVVGVFADKKLDPHTRALDKDGAIAAALARKDGSGEFGKITEAFPAKVVAGSAPRVIIVGLGKASGEGALKVGQLRSLAGAIGRRLAATKDSRIALHLHHALGEVKGLDVEMAGRCIGEGLGLIAWNFLGTRFRGSATPKKERTSLSVSAGAGASAGSGGMDFERGLETGLGLAQSANLARDLSETPPNVATPAYIADMARKMARQVGLKCTVIEGAALEREKLTGLVNVGKASENKPCLIRLEWTPRGKAASKPIVLVGKTMTYDTGGLSLKISNGMVGMKRDKDGGCAVLGAMHAIATVVQPNKRVVAYLAAAENSVSDEAYRPDDVITYRNGVTVEVTNTDAEGRLVLADALIYTCEKDNPACVIDLATLTGGVVTALGSTFAGMFCEDDALRDRLAQAMETSGERWWRLPMDPEYRDMMKSPIADILNSNPNRKAHPIQGAAFLSFFVKSGVPWAHLDIAGVHMHESDNGCFSKGSNGWGVRLLADFVGQ